LSYSDKIINEIKTLSSLGWASRKIALSVLGSETKKSTVNYILGRNQEVDELAKTEQKEALTIMFVPDCQVKPNEDLEYLDAIGQYIIDKKPDVVVNAGDFFDFPSLSSYDKGKLSFEGRRLRLDLEAGIKGMERLLAPLRDYQKTNTDYNPRMVFTLGNHECVEKSTEVLCSSGWVKASDITRDSDVASYDQFTSVVSYDKPLHCLSIADTELISVKGDFSNELVSITHRIDVDNQLVPVKDFIGEKVNQTRMKYSVKNNQVGVSLSDDELRLLTWVVTDGTIVDISERNKRVQFKLSKTRKIDYLKELLTRMGVEFTLREATKSNLNNLQPFYIRMYADAARKIFEQLNGVKNFPLIWRNMNERQLRIVLDEISRTDGCRHYNKLSWVTTSESDVDVLQFACIMNGVPFKFNSGVNRSGFNPSKSKVQYRCSIADNGVFNRRYVKVEEVAAKGTVVAIQTKNGTLITRRDGVVGFTGNCRLMRLPSENTELEGFIGYHLLDLEKDWEVHDFLKPVNIQGINFVHYLSNPFNGKPYGGNAASQLKAVGVSFCVGHKQTLDVAIQPVLDNTMRIGIVAGASYPFKEAYKGHQGNNHFRGIVMLYQAKDGFAEPAFVSTEYLINRYKTE
jgi:hypothetical protein